MIGQSINNYEIRAQIGEGGMGTVYVAEHSFMGRKAAVKVLRRSYIQDEWMVALFMNEARAANAIGHPNIIDIIDVGRLPDGQPYLMMEFLAGETLADRLARIGRLPTRDALDFVEQAAGALAVAHEKGIVHCDLKPENLFLVPDLAMRRGERVKILDFGTAKLRGDGAESDERALFGSPLYMAPEQCQEGAALRIDHRADIYALGALLYHTLCGAPPFVSERVPEILAMHLERQPTAPRTIDPEIPEHVEIAILRALAKQPDDRFASMAALMAALREPARAAVVPALPSFKRRPSGVGIATAAMACAIAGIALWTQLGPQSSWAGSARRAASRGRAVAQPAPARASGPIIVPMPSPDSETATTKTRTPRRPIAAERSIIDGEDIWGRRH